MDRTPKFSRSSNKHNFSTTNEQRTPVLDSKMFSELDNDESPVYIASTQEGCGNVDVVWDWNSPQAKQPRKSKKRLILSQSPKVLKRHPSNNNIQNFEKLREELQSLREAIALPDNEESLVLSPVEEAEYKSVHDPDINDIPPPTQEIYLAENVDDLFNDSVDEELLFCTQKIEADLENMKNDKLHNNNFVNTLNKDNNFNRATSAHSTFQPTKNFKSDTNSIDNNFNRAASAHSTLQPTRNFKTDTNSIISISRNVNAEEKDVIENIGYNKNQQTSSNFKFVRTKSENRFQFSNQVSKVEFHRTQSFESTLECTKEVIPQYKLNEIEKKRKEALAKLESKRKQDNNTSWKCSPEEIEQKRLQALAKLEAKRLQETIERKRQEALKRRELSRQKNATVVKSSLSKRL